MTTFKELRAGDQFIFHDRAMVKLNSDTATPIDEHGINADEKVMTMDEYNAREPNSWLGYLHSEGGVKVKRYFDAGDATEARESDFVSEVYGPFPAIDRDSAYMIAKNRLLGRVG